MKLKRGVNLAGIQPELVVAMIVCEGIISRYQEFTVTSILDGKHKTGSLHPKGLALDIRTRNFSGESALKNCIEDLRDALGPQFDVVRESDHIHVEFDPKP